MSSDEYIQDMKMRSAELEYEYWQIKCNIVKIELEIAKNNERATQWTAL